MGGCIEEIAMGISRFIVDSGGKDKSHYLYSDIQKIHSCGRYLGGEFNGFMKVAEKLMNFSCSFPDILVIPTPSSMYLLCVSGNMH